MRFVFPVLALLLSVGVANATDPLPSAKDGDRAQAEHADHVKAKHKHHQKKHHPMHKHSAAPTTAATKS